MTGSLSRVLETQVFQSHTRQPYPTLLSLHGYQILIAFFVFIAASWIAFYRLAPKMIRYHKRNKSKDDQVTRLKWGHMTASLLHAVIASAWSAYLWYDGSLGISAEARMWGYTKPLGHMLSFSLGYFMWDVCCCLWHIKIYGGGFLTHALLGLIGLATAFIPFMMYPASRFLLFEVSTIFINIHWFLENLGYGGSILMIINDGIVLLAYLLVRLILGSFFTYEFMHDLWELQSSLPMALCIISIVANFVTHLLNFYWFYRLCQSAVRMANRRFKISEQKFTASAQKRRLMNASDEKTKAL